MTRWKRPRIPSILLAGLLLPGALYAADVVLPHQFSAGTPAMAAQINANFNALRTGVNRRLELPVGRSAFTWAGGSVAGTATPDPRFAYSSTGGAISQTRTATGDYRVTFAGLTASAQNGGHVQLSTYIEPSSYRQCALTGWVAVATGTDVYVQCFDVAGRLADSMFTLLVVF